MKTKFRITKCLMHPNTKYVRIANCAITKDGKRHEIYTTDENDEYFEISNPYYKPIGDKLKDDLADHFYNRFTDAVQAVRDGYAHAIIGSPNPNSVFQKQSRAVYFLDETLGEKYRKKTIDGFVNAKFGYNVKFGGKNSFIGYNLVDSELKTIGWYNPGTPAFFETYDEANRFITDALNKAKAAADLVINEEKAFEEVIDSIANTPVIRDMFLDIIDENNNIFTYKNDGKLTNFGYDIVQAIQFKME